MLLAKVTDDLLLAGNIDIMKDFIKKLTERFKVSKAILDGPIDFNGCRIEQ